MQTNPLLTNTPNAGAPNPGEALGDYPQQCQAHLEGQGYTRRTVAEYVRCIEAVGRLMRQHGVGLGDLDEAQTAAFLAQTESPLCRRTSAKYVVRLLVRFLRAQGGPLPVAIPTPKARARARLRHEYEEYLRRQRGLSERTLPHCWRLADRCLEFRFGEPAQLLHCQRILALPDKCYVRRTVDFLDQVEMKALLTAPDRSTWVGRRDHALLIVALQTGLRASELIHLRRSDVVTGTGAHLRCAGKGRKQRATPLRRETLQVLEAWLKESGGADPDPLFPTHHGTKLSRDALEHLVRRHTLAAAKSCPSLSGKRVSPHVLRHSTAMDLLHHGVDQTGIALWLGHETVQTVQVHTHADLRLKEKALARLTAPDSKPGRYRPDDKLLAFLEAL